jgi:hypothetical protein
MEIASLTKYAFIRKARNMQGLSKCLLFFTPCEEMNGGSVFSKLAANYNIIQPYLDKIDGTLINLMNINIRNILRYIGKPSSLQELMKDPS